MMRTLFMPKNYRLLMFLLTISILWSACQTEGGTDTRSERNQAKMEEEKVVSTPEKNLKEYYEYLQQYDVRGLRSLLFDPFTDYYPPRGLVVNTYQIGDSIILSQAEADAIAYIPPLKAGDLQLKVNEIRNGEAQRFTYWFRQKNEQWLICGWSLHVDLEEEEDDL